MVKMLPLLEGVPPVLVLDRALEAIAESYGARTANFVALTMEYDRRSEARGPASARPAAPVQ